MEKPKKIYREPLLDLKDELDKEPGANIHKAGAAAPRTYNNLYEGIDTDLLIRVRGILDAYLITNAEFMTEEGIQQLVHDIDLLDREVGATLSIDEIHDCLQSLIAFVKPYVVGSATHLRRDRLLLSPYKLDCIKDWIATLPTQVYDSDGNRW